MSFNLEKIFQELSTDWKDDPEIQKIIQKHAPKVNELLGKEQLMYTDAVEIYPKQEHILNCFNHFNKSKLNSMIFFSNCPCPSDFGHPKVLALIAAQTGLGGFILTALNR